MAPNKSPTNDTDSQRRSKFFKVDFEGGALEEEGRNSLVNSGRKAIFRDRSRDFSGVTPQAFSAIFSARLKSYRVAKSTSYFDRRVTNIEFHPSAKYPTVMAISSKGGDIVLWNYEVVQDMPAYSQGDTTGVPFLTGIGKGGSVTMMKFSPYDDHAIYTTSIDGTVRKQDFSGKHSLVFLDTMNLDKWWVSLDVSRTRNLLAVGSNSGEIALTSLAGETVCKHRLHKSKVQDIEFHPSSPNSFVTASNDKTIKLWDVRTFSSSSATPPKPVSILAMKGIPNNAVFSPVAPYTLLATTQNSYIELISTSAQSFQRVATVHHPHRVFQHLTPICAVWHPLLPGFFSCGRYPDPKTEREKVTLALDDVLDDKRSVDTYEYCSDPKSDTFGSVRLRGRIIDPSQTKIMPVIRWNTFGGDVLATGSGFSTSIWKFRDDDGGEVWRENGGGGGGGSGKKGGGGGGGGGSGGGRGDLGRGRKKRQNGDDIDNDDDVSATKKRIKTKAKVSSKKKEKE